MAQALQSSLFSRLRFSGRVDLHIHFPHGGETMRMETMIGVLSQSKGNAVVCHTFECFCSI